MSDDDFPVDGSSGLAVVADRDKRAPRFSWTPAYEATFFRSLCESVQLGLRENHSFKAEAWDRAAVALQEKHAAYPTKSHLVNKSDNARKKFRLWRGLREDPEFLYNPNSKTVSATEEAWKAHIEKEPLSRALRGRPFEHEEYMEVLYPDVIGSGGAPKRIMKPKRKGTDAQGQDDSDMPGTSVLDLQVESPYRPQSQTPTMPQHRHSMGQPSPGLVQPHQVLSHQRPTSTAIPPRTHITGTSALTPPEETASHGRRKFPGGHNQAGSHGGAGDASKKAPTASMSMSMGPPTNHNNNTSTHPPPGKRRRTTSSYPQHNHNAPAQSPVTTPNTTHSGPANAAAATTATNTTTTTSSAENAALSLATAGKELVEDSLIRIVDALRSRAPPRWPEQAMDIFFRDFSDEDMDLQLKIAEKALSDENKAMVFCKMPPALRRHWVKRLREVHNNRVT